MKKSLYDWSNQEYSHLPWRKKRTLYRTLVSEIMLQQTNVSTVLNHFDRFLKVFPDIKSLALASEEEVCANWQGLGFYRRARSLRKAALCIVEDFNEKFPINYEQLISIPGIGPYTANAIISIGRDKKALALDANLERVLARVYEIREVKGPKLLKLIQMRESEILKDFKIEQYGARVINESLMDLGRVYCQAKKADCILCPISSKCLTFKNKKNPLDIPFVDKKKKITYELKLLRVILRENKTIMGFQKNKNEWLSAQIEIPTFILDSEDKTNSQYPKIKFKDYDKEQSIKTAITKYKIINYVVEMTSKEFESLLISNHIKCDRYKYYPLNVDQVHFSSATIKCFKLIFI